MSVITKKLVGERRLYERKTCGIAIDIDVNFQRYTGHLRNLSLGGAYIEPSSNLNLKVGKELVITIPYRQRRGFVSVRGRIARAKSDGLAITFI